MCLPSLYYLNVVDTLDNILTKKCHKKQRKVTSLLDYVTRRGHLNSTPM